MSERNSIRKGQKLLRETTSQRRTLSLNRFSLCVVVMCSSNLLLSGCAQKMGSQPAYRPLEQSDFFKDGQASREPPVGTVPRSYYRENTFLPSDTPALLQQTAGASSGQHLDTRILAASNTAGETATTANTTAPDNSDAFPLPITEQLVARGRERFNIYCSVCHGLAGYGDGMIVQRGYSQPPSFHTDTMRAYPVSLFYNVISKGFGAMPSYAAQIAPNDRWAIVAFLRALQVSQHSTLADVPADAQQQLNSAGGRQQ